MPILTSYSLDKANENRCLQGRTNKLIILAASLNVRGILLGRHQSCLIFKCSRLMIKCIYINSIVIEAVALVVLQEVFGKQRKKL